jgi:tRNA 2-selenouridine synthase
MSGMGDVLCAPIDELRQLPGVLIDVRSPSEHAKGHWPGAVNVPLFSDAERAEVGTAYKQEGRRAAIHHGLAISGPKMARLAAQLDALSGDHPPRIYCWRGGMRSASVAWLAALLDLQPRVLDGGYKSYRHWVLNQFEQQWPLKLMGGRTGTGKTDLLLALRQQGVSVVDLEGLANHRGSSFGGLGQPPQPSTEHYENLLAEQLDGFRRINASSIWLEAESIQVGRCRIPAALFKQMQQAPVLEIRRSLDERIEQLVAVYGRQGQEALAAATQRISRRLGPQRTSKALQAIDREDWAAACEATLDYYDRCYDRELERCPERQSLDISGTSAEQAAERMIASGLVKKHA